MKAAGYEVSGETGSALTAEGRGSAFYVWTVGTRAEDSQPTDDGVRTSWAAHGFTFWVESGPAATDVKPTADELRRIVAASRWIPPPPADE